MEDAWPALKAARVAVRLELGDDPVADLTTRRQQLAKAEGGKNRSQKLLDQWEEYLARESILYSLLSWLRPVAQKRMRLARVFLKENQAPEHIYKEPLKGEQAVEHTGKDRQSIEEFETAIRANANQFQQAVDECKAHLQRGEEAFRAEQEQLAKWRSALVGLGISADAERVSLTECDILADTHTRFAIFLLTTHYWEGRWLLEMQALLPKLDDEKRKTGRQTLVKRWRRRMKLTPCVVSTFFMLPSLLKAL